MMNHIVYFDNFYTSLAFLVYQRARGIYSLGTIRTNRIPNCKLPNDKDIKDEPRGYSTEFIGSAYGVDISTVLWKDNKSVRLVSTYVGVNDFQRNNPNVQPAKAARYDRSKKKFIEVDSPKIIREYNSHMGGVDLMDGLMGRYHIRIKSRDAIVRLFYHFLDMALTNSYVLYRRINAEKKKDSNYDVEEKLLNLPEFREEIADKLVKFTEKKSVGRPKTSGKRTSVDEPLSPLPGSSAHGRKPKHPTEDLRYDGQDHFPRWLPKSGGKKQCKNSGCKSGTQCVCTKCNLHLS